MKWRFQAAFALTVLILLGKQGLLNFRVHAGEQFGLVGKGLPVRRYHGFQAAFPVFQAA